MTASKRSFQDLGFEEKLTVIDDYLTSLRQTDSIEMLSERMEWLRRHIPAYSDEGENYVFISYSHKDFKAVYSDLAFFSYDKKKVRFWYDEGLPAGENWLRVATERLSDPCCVGVIFYLSENFLHSSAVLSEIKLVQSLGKPYFTISLESNKFCAADYLTEPGDAELLAKVDSVFPRNDTTVSYDTGSAASLIDEERVVIYNDRYEDIIYRVKKIEQAFGVVEDTFSDFIFEEVEDGLSLVEYRGYNTEIYIPAKIGRLPVVEIKAAFDNATEIFIPATVKRILPVEIDIGNDKFVEEDQNTWSITGVILFSIGDHKPLSAVFGEAGALRSVRVDSQSPYFYDTDGVLYSRDNTLVRFPENHEWNDSYSDGVKTIGVGAFLGYKSNEFISFTQSVESVEACAFALADVLYISFEEGVRTVGPQAFAYCNTMRGDLGMPIMLPHTVESIGEFAFREASMPFLSINGNSITEIPRGAFFGFKGDFISIPNSVKIIHKGAFALCSNLESIELSKSLLAIDANAFIECKKLYSVDIPRGIMYLSDSAFETTNILSYILYGGSSRDLYYLRVRNEIEESSFVDIIITKDQWLSRLKARCSIGIRKFVLKFAEKLSAPRDPGGDSIGRKSSVFSKISFTSVVYFLLIALIIFFVEYRRIVLGVPADLIYWLLAGSCLAISLASGRHIYWSRILNRHKRKIKLKKQSVSFLDAWCNITAMGIAIVAVISIIIAGIIWGIFNPSGMRDLFS